MTHLQSPNVMTVDLSVVRKAVSGALESVIRAEPTVTKYDTLVGDGDCGEALKRGAGGKNKWTTSGTI